MQSAIATTKCSLNPWETDNQIHDKNIYLPWTLHHQLSNSPSTESRSLLSTLFLYPNFHFLSLRKNKKMVELKGGTRPPWVGLGAAVWVQVAAGNGYNFPLYSHSLKSVLGVNQQQLTILGVANDIGENMGILPGLACNKFPPWVILLIGSFCCFLGYGVLWLTLSRTVLSLPYWLVRFLSFYNFFTSLCCQVVDCVQLNRTVPFDTDQPKVHTV